MVKSDAEKQKKYRDGVASNVKKILDIVEHQWALRDIVFGKTYFFKDIDSLKRFINS